MNSSELFSHPYEPTAVSRSQHDPEPVQLPTFSDRPDKVPPAATPSS
ncbi:hypothetical protein [Mycobacterium sherrisii]|nr:hypothetical protein [Mycobacterium sherrisii]MCV7031039.1 hypothetical protein [Mycobacterium sherrisii]MEC4765462.1 hypothetical protein [Mycobacterium sherrisii]